MNRRIFLGIFPKEDALSFFEAQQEKYREAFARLGISARWQSRSQWHMTLLFLGSLPEESVQNLIRDLTSREWKHPCTQVLDHGLEFPGVLALGASQTTPELQALKKELNAHCPTADKKPFRPHVTLARVEKRDISRALEEVKVESVRLRIDSFQIVQSHTEPQGSRYETLQSISLVE